MGVCGDLLRVWCDKLLELQVTSVSDPALGGGILCPACAGIRGRCFDAIYPFLYLADADGDSRYLEAAKMLFDWAENTVSREDGSYVNDTNSDWKGTTVFSVIQLTEALTFHGHLLDSVTYESRESPELQIFSALLKNSKCAILTTALPTALPCCYAVICWERRVMPPGAVNCFGGRSEISRTAGFFLGKGVLSAVTADADAARLILVIIWRNRFLP